MTMLMSVDHLNRHDMEKLTYDKLQKHTNHLTDTSSSAESQLLMDEKLYQSKDTAKRGKFFNRRGRALKKF